MKLPGILHLIHHLDPGGAETFFTDLLPALRGRGFDVHAACLNRGGILADKLHEKDIPVHLIDKRRGPDIGAVLRLRRLLRQLDAGILNTHEYSAYFWGGTAAGPGGPVIVSTIHAEAGWHSPAKHLAVSGMLRGRTAAYVAVSEVVADSIARKERVPRRKITVIPNGVDLSRLKVSGNKRKELRRKYGIPAEVAVAGMAGRCSAEKGGEYFLRAVAEVNARGLPLYALLAGEGPEKSRWERLAAESGIGGKAVFAGPVSGIGAFMQMFDFLVCPSIEESFGLAAIEGQAAGVPVIATCVGGVPEVLNNESDAILVPPRNAGAIASAVMRLSAETGLKEKLVEAGKVNVMKRFTIERAADLYGKLYIRLTEESN